MGSNFEIDVSKLELEESISEYLRSLPERDLWKYVYDEYYVKQHLSGIKIAGILGCKSYCVYDYFKKFGFSSRSDSEKGRLYDCDHDFFKIIDTEEKAYWLGFMYADGYITSQRKNNNRKVGISLAEVDKNHLEKFKECLKATYPIKTYKVSSGYNPNSTYCRLLITSPKMAQDLIDKGCVENKTDILEFPTINQLPLYLRKHFIRGYFDGDGSIWHTNSSTTHSIDFCGTDNLLMGIMHELLSQHVIEHTYNFDKRKPGQIVSRFRFGGNQLVKSFCEYIYNDATIYLDRKYQKYQEMLNLMSDYRKNQENICYICGDTYSREYNMWKHGGEYDGKILCRKHWEQMRKVGYISDFDPVKH